DDRPRVRPLCTCPGFAKQSHRCNSPMPKRAARMPKKTPARCRGLCLGVSWSALELLVALAVIAASLLDPFQAAVAIAGLIGVVLIETGVHPSLPGALL